MGNGIHGSRLPIPEYWGLFPARKFKLQAGSEGVGTPPALRTLDVPQDLRMLMTGDGVGGRGESGVVAESGCFGLEGVGGGFGVF